MQIRAERSNLLQKYYKYDFAHAKWTALKDQDVNPPRHNQKSKLFYTKIKTYFMSGLSFVVDS